MFVEILLRISSITLNNNGQIVIYVTGNDMNLFDFCNVKDEMMENVNFNKATLVDIRSADLFSEGRAPGAVSLPVDELPHRISDIEKMKKPVIMYGDDSNHVEMEIIRLSQNGITGIINGGSLEDVLKQIKL